MVTFRPMTKSEAINLFSSVSELADALDVSRQAIYKWPHGELKQEQVDRIVGAAIRTGRMNPADAPLQKEQRQSCGRRATDRPERFE